MCPGIIRTLYTSVKNLMIYMGDLESRQGGAGAGAAAVPGIGGLLRSCQIF